MAKEIIIDIHFANGDTCAYRGYETIFKDYMDSEKCYLPIDRETYIMKNNINFIRIEEIEENKEEK